VTQTPEYGSWQVLTHFAADCLLSSPIVRTLVVNEMIRLAGIKFDKVVKHSARLGGGAAEGSSLHYLGEDTHNCLGALVRDQKAEAENAAVVDISAQGS
jgi:pyruvate/oxaloacetate carboxyltransferase